MGLPTLEIEDPLYDRGQAEQYLAVNERWIRRAVAERRIRYTRVGGLLRFRKSWLDDYLREHERAPAVVVRAPAKRKRRRLSQSKAAA